jgi:hypothetical protein
MFNKIPGHPTIVGDAEDLCDELRDLVKKGFGCTAY